MTISTPTIIEIALAFLTVVLLTTGFRLSVRKRVRWGWDDLFAALAALSLVVQVIVICVRFLKVLKLPMTPEVSQAGVAIYYINFITFAMEDWFARLSILFTVIRITSSPYYRRSLFILAVVFVGCLLYSVVPLVAVCAKDDTWEHTRLTNCPVPSYLPLSSLGVSILADVALVTIPIYLLRTFKPDPLIRQRLQVVFAVTLLLTIAGIIQVILFVVSPGIAHLVAALVEGFIAIMLCNISVVFFALLHLFGIRMESGSATRQRKRMDKPTISSALFTNITLNTIGGSSSGTNETPSLESSFPTGEVTTTFGDRWRTVSEVVDIGDPEPTSRVNNSDDARAHTCTA